MAYLDEIVQQPGVLKLVINNYLKANNSSTEKLRLLLRDREFEQIIFTGLGSSLIASYPAGSFLRSRGIKAFSIDANELLKYDYSIISRNTLVVAISQSGNTLEVIELHKKFSNMGNVINVTNMATGKLYKCGNINFEIMAGEEHYSSTKTYTSSIAVLLYIAYILAGFDESIEKLGYLYYKCTGIIEEILKDKSKINEIQDFIGNPVYIAFIGSGPSYATAEYGQLCFEEVDRIYSSSYKASQFLHGPIEIINNNYRAIVLDLAAETREEVDKIICCITQYDGKVVLITNREIQYNHGNLLKYKINYADSYTSPIIEAIPIQLLAYNIAADKKFDPGKLLRIPK